MASIKTELVEGSDPCSHAIIARPSLRSRARLAQFALEHGLATEAEAALVVIARYFEMVEDDRWAAWLATREDAPESDR